MYTIARGIIQLQRKGEKRQVVPEQLSKSQNMPAVLKSGRQGSLRNDRRLCVINFVTFEKMKLILSLSGRMSFPHVFPKHDVFANYFPLLPAACCSVNELQRHVAVVFVFLMWT
jgi:hypothetical protein